MVVLFWNSHIAPYIVGVSQIEFIVLHGTALGALGRRMSGSKGDVVFPIHLLGQIKLWEPDNDGHRTSKKYYTWRSNRMDKTGTYTLMLKMYKFEDVIVGN